MAPDKKDIIRQLEKELLALQGFKTVKGRYPVDIGLGEIANAFPNQTFPLAGVHEFVTSTMENAGSTTAFIAALLSPLFQTGGAVVWIAQVPYVFPPALKQFGIEPDRIIFVHPKQKKDIGWVTEEALQCEALSTVVSEWSDLSFIESRRLQLAVEKSKVTGIILRRSPKQLNTTACVSRWQISSVPSQPIDQLPGIGFPKWNVELLKVRNGKPGAWIAEWAGDHIQLIETGSAIIRQLIRKTG